MRLPPILVITIALALPDFAQAKGGGHNTNSSEGKITGETKVKTIRPAKTTGKSIQTGVSRTSSGANGGVPAGGAAKPRDPGANGGVPAGGAAKPRDPGANGGVPPGGAAKPRDPGANGGIPAGGAAKPRDPGANGGVVPGGAAKGTGVNRD